MVETNGGVGTLSSKVQKGRGEVDRGPAALEICLLWETQEYYENTSDKRPAVVLRKTGSYGHFWESYISIDHVCSISVPASI